MDYVSGWGGSAIFEFEIGATAILERAAMSLGQLDLIWTDGLVTFASLGSRRSAIWKIHGADCRVHMEFTEGSTRVRVTAFSDGPRCVAISATAECEVAELFHALLDAAERFFKWYEHAGPGIVRTSQLVRIRELRQRVR